MILRKRKMSLASVLYIITETHVVCLLNINIVTRFLAVFEQIIIGKDCGPFATQDPRHRLAMLTCRCPRKMFGLVSWLKREQT